MCLLLLDKNAKPTTLTEELMVYKMLRPTKFPIYFKSPFHSFTYMIGRPCQTEFTFNNEFRWADTVVRDLMLKQPEEISKWFQPYEPPPVKANATMWEIFDNSHKNEYIKERREALREVLFSVNAGFHACETLERAEVYHENQRFSGDLFSCLLPAGTQVYRDTTGLITSNQIIVGDVINYKCQKRFQTI